MLRKVFRRTSKRDGSSTGTGYRDDTAGKVRKSRENARTCCGVKSYAGLHPYNITRKTRRDFANRPATALLIHGLDCAERLMDEEGKGPKSALKALLAYIESIGESQAIRKSIKPFREALNEMGGAAANRREIDRTRLETVLQNMRIEVVDLQERREAAIATLSGRGIY